jgi:hypothetical protein
METSSKLHEDATRWRCLGLIGHRRSPLFWDPSLGASILGFDMYFGINRGHPSLSSKIETLARVEVRRRYGRPCGFAAELQLRYNTLFPFAPRALLDSDCQFFRFPAPATCISISRPRPASTDASSGRRTPPHNDVHNITLPNAASLLPVTCART